MGRCEVEHPHLGGGRFIVRVDGAEGVPREGAEQGDGGIGCRRGWDMWEECPGFLLLPGDPSPALVDEVITDGGERRRPPVRLDPCHGLQVDIVLVCLFLGSHGILGSGVGGDWAPPDIVPGWFDVLFLVCVSLIRGGWWEIDHLEGTGLG